MDECHHPRPVLLNLGFPPWLCPGRDRVAGQQVSLPEQLQVTAGHLYGFASMSIPPI